MVALAHTLHWGGYALNQNWSLFGVSCFFVISGAVIYHNYKDPPPLDLFIFKRFARLAPLYCLAMLMTYVGMQYAMSWNVVFQATMLFGLLDNRCMVLGCWTLGVEVVLYLLFPVLLSFTRSLRMAIGLFAVLLVLRVSGLEDTTAANWWGFYINPGSFVALFFGGMLVAKYAPRMMFANWLWGIGAAVLFAALFAFPTTRAQIYGLEGVALALACIMLVACFWHLHVPLSGFLGEISYGVYLLHPIVWGALHTVLGVPVWLCVASTLPITAAASWIALRFYETPAKRWLIGRFMAWRDDPPASPASAPVHAIGRRRTDRPEIAMDRAPIERPRSRT